MDWFGLGCFRTPAGGQTVGEKVQLVLMGQWVTTMVNVHLRGDSATIDARDYRNRYELPQCGSWMCGFDDWVADKSGLVRHGRWCQYIIHMTKASL